MFCFRSPAALQELETQLAKAKEDLTTAGLKLRAMIRAFKENQLYVTPLTAGDSEQGTYEYNNMFKSGSCSKMVKGRPTAGVKVHWGGYLYQQVLLLPAILFRFH